MLFVAAGLLLGNGHVHDVTVSIDTTTIRVLAEITLAVVLFSDASGIDPEQLRHNAAWPIRLLAIGLPASMALGTAVGAAGPQEAREVHEIGADGVDAQPVPGVLEADGPDQRVGSGPCRRVGGDPGLGPRPGGAGEHDDVPRAL
jgi:hypothetical protein